MLYKRCGSDVCVYTAKADLPHQLRQKEGWETEWKDRYYQILREADEVYYISDRYSRCVYQKRNEWMIDHASMVIAGYTGAAGGTRNTLEYAKKKKDYIIRLIEYDVITENETRI